MSTEYTVWVDKGQALLGEFRPAGTVAPHALLRLKVGPPDILTNEVSIFFWDEADMEATARTLRAITEALERTLRPKYVPGEPCPKCGYVCIYPNRHPHCCNCGLGQGVEGHE